MEFGVITSFAYQLEDKSGEIVVATTRCVGSTASLFCWLLMQLVLQSGDDAWRYRRGGAPR